MPEVTRKWYDERSWSVLLGILALLLAYALGSRALDTGSWQQYILTFLLVIFAINRFVQATKSMKKSKGRTKV